MRRFVWIDEEAREAEDFAKGYKLRFRPNPWLESPAPDSQGIMTTFENSARVMQGLDLYRARINRSLDEED